MIATNPKRQIPRPALRLVSTKDMDRDTWLRIRKNGIGSSDAAAAAGVCPYRSQLELWLIKTGRDTSMPRTDPHDDKSPTYWGTLLEPFVAEAYTRRTGNRVRRVNAILQHPDSDKAWMLANIDREIIGSPDVQVLECKTTGEFGARLWKHGVPEHIQCQVQHQLAVTGKHAADVCVLLCGQELQVHRIYRDDELIARLIELERRFWRYVETDTPPPVDGSDSSALALQYLYPREERSVVDLSSDADMESTFSRLRLVRDEAAAFATEEALLKQRIQERMADHARAHFAAGDVSWRRSKDSITLDTVRLLQDQPQLLEQYPQVKRGSRRFLIHA